ncbi:hypothetical protein B4168_3807 [Anoxybacillus flavithermus]|nr:hypothetical protein B4168_3807 [Anoxybacillus flavithermus]OAO88008.1 hypothetical protein GT23_0741 [Parageobacillus thermoglucosidasius]
MKNASPFVLVYRRMYNVIVPCLSIKKQASNQPLACFSV